VNKSSASPVNDGALVSVIIPAWNAGEWIAETVDSVVRQDWLNLEVIVVDDQSTDKTASIVRNCVDARVRHVAQSHAGASAARNRGLRESRGDLIQFLDADDLLGHDKVRLQVEALSEQPAGSIASCRWSRFSNDIESADRVVETISEESDPIEWLTQSLNGGNMMHPAAWLIPRTIADQAGPWNERLSLHDDGEYFARVLARATRNVFVPGAEVFYRTLPASLSQRRSRSAIESAFAVCRARHETLLRARDDSRTRQAVATQYAQFAYEFNSSGPDLSRAALQEIDKLGVEPANSIGSSSFRKSVQLIGLKNALQLRKSISRE
jgi:glycosyltransferase involved in cell wall biosynthesis